MVCPFCLHAKTEVFNSRGSTRLNTVWRRRRCTACDGQFTTYESADPASLIVVKDKRTLTAFSHNRLQLTLLKCCDHRDDLDDCVPYLAATIEQKLIKMAAESKSPSITKDKLQQTTASTLKNYDPVAYIKFIGQHPELTNALRRALNNQLKSKKTV